ncbi:MAG: aliphatic sulfonate ABC transporter substrate-binding protein [Thermomicrobiales bacterium]
MNSPFVSRLSRRAVLGFALASAAAPLVGALPSSRALAGGEVRIGYQKGSASLLVLKAEGELEDRLGTLGYTVTWNEFPSGPPLLEALNAGSIDFGATGAPPPIFAQAAGADLIYALASRPSPLTQAIIVPPDSPIQSPAELKGKKVAVTKGSSANALLVRALQTSDLQWGDAEAVFLQPADAKAAFEGGSVDAWSIWDPYYAAEEAASGARTIATDESVGTPNRSFYLASRTFATDHADALAALATALTETDTWADTHPEEVAKLISQETGLDEAILLKVEARRVYGIEPLSQPIIEDQQKLADLFFDIGLIPKKIDVASATLIADPA